MVLLGGRRPYEGASLGEGREHEGLEPVDDELGVVAGHFGAELRDAVGASPELASGVGVEVVGARVGPVTLVPATDDAVVAYKRARRRKGEGGGDTSTASQSEASLNRDHPAPPFRQSRQSTGKVLHGVFAPARGKQAGRSAAAGPPPHLAGRPPA